MKIEVKRERHEFCLSVPNVLLFSRGFYSFARLFGVGIRFDGDFKIKFGKDVTVSFGVDVKISKDAWYAMGREMKQIKKEYGEWEFLTFSTPDDRKVRIAL
ncbi:MAG: hypothetical protein LUH54_01965 [Firmicutes bacterium]|nr:hypothetical protein [Bacillota bacterium]